GVRFTNAMRVESACSSGSAAFRAALMAVGSGQLDSALVVGVEKMTDSPSDEITAQLATAADADWEQVHGISFVALNALVMRRYMHEYGWEPKDFAYFTVNAHKNAMTTPNARLHIPVTEASYLKAPMITPPINLMDASSIGDGAAAVVIVPTEALAKFPENPSMKVLGSGAATDTIAVHDRKVPLYLSAANKSVQQAYDQAKLVPKDIDIFELHDAFTIMAALSLEACGFAEQGKGPTFASEEKISLKGELPIATMGGLKARGHPVGATGMYQIAEVYLQLTGQAGANQVEKARIAMTQNIGGSGSNLITHIFQVAG
ncbi:MAG TPA: beta-ketoacyl synthase N-terminal-like domain-containing protein, partial [Bellilinea sp.]|nr:beta-ketoacyl synthase N-terminal-like domain-containing protein [Bellilinea sp.]